MESKGVDISTKRNVLGALILTVAFIIIGVSTSYAYYMNSVDDSGANKNVSATTGGLTMAFKDSTVFTANSIGLINDSNVLTQASHTDFSVTLPSGAAVSKANYKLYLSNTKITSNFKSAYLKWALYSGSSKLSEGNFGNVTLSSSASGGLYTVTSELPLLSNLSINRGETKAYTLYFWLSNVDGVQQNSLLQGTLNTKVAFRAESTK